MFASNLGVRQYNIDSAWNDGTNDTARIEAGGRARFGTNVDSPANTFLDINPALGLATFRGVAEFLAGSSGLDNIADGTNFAKTNATIISGGNIRVGTGVKDSTLDGWHIDSTEIVGQLDGADQVVLGTDGKITFNVSETTPYMRVVCPTATYPERVHWLHWTLAGDSITYTKWSALGGGNVLATVLMTATDLGVGYVTLDATGAQGTIRLDAAVIKHNGKEVISVRTTAWDA